MKKLIAYRMYKNYVNNCIYLYYNHDFGPYPTYAYTKKQGTVLKYKK